MHDDFKCVLAQIENEMIAVDGYANIFNSLI